MGREIKNPYDSKNCLLLLCHIDRIDEPYGTNVARTLNKQYQNIQGYIDTMVQNGWLERPEGRKAELEIKPEYIVSGHPSYLSVVNTLKDGVSEDQEEEVEEKVLEIFSTAFLKRMRSRSVSINPFEKEENGITGYKVGQTESYPEEVEQISTRSTPGQIISEISNMLVDYEVSSYILGDSNQKLLSTESAIEDTDEHYTIEHYKELIESDLFD